MLRHKPKPDLRVDRMDGLLDQGEQIAHPAADILYPGRAQRNIFRLLHGVNEGLARIIRPHLPVESLHAFRAEAAELHAVPEKFHIIVYPKKVCPGFAYIAYFSRRNCFRSSCSGQKQDRDLSPR